MIDNHNNHAPERDCCDYKMADDTGGAGSAVNLKLSKVEFDLYSDLFKRDRDTAIAVIKLKYPHVASSKVVKIMPEAEGDPTSHHADSVTPPALSSSACPQPDPLPTKSTVRPTKSPNTPSTSLVDHEPESAAAGLSPRTVWTREAVLLLLDLYEGKVPKMKDPRIKNKAVWKEISDKLIERNHNYSADSCERKFLNLKAAFTATTDHNNTTGNNRKSCPFYEEFARIYGMSHSVHPPTVYSNIKGFERREEGQGDLPQAESVDGTADGAGSDQREPRMRKKKRRTSASDSFLAAFEDYRKEKQERETEKKEMMERWHRDNTMINESIP
ncbi:uncharacterized protein [Ptychodera flava]|uniref:uncharacterized protein n=1 Tax=Ptychodera flava TaxID=63121 RepID=UPI00396AAEB6